MKRFTAGLLAFSLLSLTVFETSAIARAPLTEEFIRIDLGTKTATAVAGAATLNKSAGVVTTEALTTVAAGVYTLTLTNSKIAAADQVFVSINNGTNSAGSPQVERVTPAAGSVVIVIRNAHISTAFNGTLKIAFMTLKN